MSGLSLVWYGGPAGGLPAPLAAGAEGGGSRWGVGQVGVVLSDCDQGLCMTASEESWYVGRGVAAAGGRTVCCYPALMVRVGLDGLGVALSCREQVVRLWGA